MNERWCGGLCENLLPPEAFRLDRGRRRLQCRACERAMSRARNRKRYQNDAAYRARQQERARDTYHRNPGPKIAAVVARKKRLRLAQLLERTAA